MLFSTASICINPKFPVKQAGFIQQVAPIFNVHDDLMAYIMGFIQDEEQYYLISLDNLGMPLSFQLELEKALQVDLQNKVHVIISSTHTHFGGAPNDEEYSKQVFDQLNDAIIKMEYEIFNKMEVSYQSVYFDEVGKSRISNHECKNIYLDVIKIFGDEKLVASLIIYNCHPTIQSGLTPYFSSEYPGYVLKKLRENNPNQFFTFMQGADGDISTRFTRPSQDYQAVKIMGDKLYLKISKLLKDDTKKTEIKLSYCEQILSVVHNFDTIDLSKIPAHLSDRELETIEYGKKAREKLEEKKGDLPKSILISKIDFNGVKLIFAPNELFSGYINAINKEHSCLVCYSNGYLPYVSDIGTDIITYEVFTDTLSDQTKKEYFNILKDFGV